MGKSAREGESPVEATLSRCVGILSRAGLEKPRLNQPAPSGKAKYIQETDSEPVPRGKGEKNPKSGSEKDLKPYACKRSELMLFHRHIQ